MRTQLNLVIVLAMAFLAGRLVFNGTLDLPFVGPDFSDLAVEVDKWAQGLSSDDRAELASVQAILRSTAQEIDSGALTTIEQATAKASAEWDAKLGLDSRVRWTSWRESFRLWMDSAQKDGRISSLSDYAAALRAVAKEMG